MIRTLQNRLKLSFFPAISDDWLAVLRIGLGLQLIVYCLSLGRDWAELFGGENEGLINREMMESLVKLDAAFVPNLGWVVNWAGHVGLTDHTTLWIVWTILLLAGCALVLGLFSRISAIVGWFFYVAASKSGNLLIYGVDNFTTIGLFYLMLAPLADRYSLDRIIFNAPAKDRHLHGFFRRALQLHLCVIYFFGGLTKSLGAGWWTGESLWRALTRPPFNILPVNFIISGRALLTMLGIIILILETGYPIFVWFKKTRPLWLIAIVCMHVAIGLTMGLYLFAMIMIILNLAAFAPGVFWQEKAPPQITESESLL